MMSVRKYKCIFLLDFSISVGIPLFIVALELSKLIIF